MNTLYQSYTFTSQKSDHRQIEYLVEELDLDLELEDHMEDFNESDENGNCPLIFAVLQGRDETVRSLVDQGAYVNHQNYEGETPLYWAAKLGLDNIVDTLVENGANLNICNLDGVSALHIAAASGHCDIITKLVRNGAYINAQDHSKDTPLHYAVREGRPEVVEFLIRVCKAKVDVKNEDMETPLDLAHDLECIADGPYKAISSLLSANHTTPAFGEKMPFKMDTFSMGRTQPASVY